MFYYALAVSHPDGFTIRYVMPHAADRQQVAERLLGRLWETLERYGYEKLHLGGISAPESSDVLLAEA